MLSYQHAFHAGNHADVAKHACLIHLLTLLKAKPRPLCYFDSHAGRGLYDLEGAEADKTLEASTGLLQLSHFNPAPTWAKAYLEAWQGWQKFYHLNEAYLCPRNETLITPYAGSPLMASWVLAGHQGVKLILCEKHTNEANRLKRVAKPLVRSLALAGYQPPLIQIHERDAWEALIALTPPQPRRGLVLIDPSYELERDYEQAIEAIPNLRQRWAEAVIILWYPIMRDGRHNRLDNAMRKAIAKDNGWLGYFHLSETTPAIAKAHNLLGSGIAIFNPPFGSNAGLDEIAKGWIKSFG